MPAGADLSRAGASSKAFWLVLLQVHHLLLRIPLYAAIDPRLRVPFQKVEEVAPGLSVLECNQQRDRQDGNDVLQEHVQRDTRDLPVEEPSEDIGKRRYSQDHER